MGRHVFILMFLISCSRVHLISLKCETVWTADQCRSSRPTKHLERLADPNRRLEGECMAAQKITRLRHTKKVETGAGTPAPASTLGGSRRTDMA